MLRPIATVSTGTLGSRLLGFARDAMLAALFGASAVADAFLFAFQFVNVARRLLSEGALNAALVPAYLRTRSRAGETAAAAFAGRALGTIGIALIVATLALGIAMPCAIALLAPGFSGRPEFQLAVESARLMLPYLAFAGPVAVLAGVLNANGRVAFTSFSPLLFNITLIAVIAALLIASDMHATTSAFVLATTIGIAGCLQAAVLVFAGRGTAWPIHVSLGPEMRTLLGRALPGMIAQAGPQLLLVTGAIVASASPASVSWLYFASRLVELPLGIVGTATGTVLLPKLSSTAQADDRQAHGATSSLALQLGLGLALPAAVGLAMLAQPIVVLLYERGAFTASDTVATALALAVFAAALPAQALIKTFSSVFFARERMTAPALATLAGLALAFIAALLAHPRWGHAGIAAAISLGAWLTAIVLAIRLATTGEVQIDRRGWHNLAGIVLASVIMGITIAAADHFMAPAGPGLWSQVVRLGTLIALGMMIDAAALRLFGVVSFAIVRKAFGKAP
jgi:putative peptidoglycan lipid II flippase